MKKYIIISTLFFVFAFMTACSEKSHGHPEVQITSPTSGQQIDHGDTLTITAVVTHTDALHEYDVRVIRVSDRAELYSFEDHTHETQLNISRQWVNDVTEMTDLRVIVRANDHAGNAGADSVDFHAHH